MRTNPDGPQRKYKLRTDVNISDAEHITKLPSLPPTEEDILTPEDANAYLAQTLNSLTVAERIEANGLAQPMMFVARKEGTWSIPFMPLEMIEWLEWQLQTLV